MSRARPVLHRDDPDKSPLIGHVKVTRSDWLNTARDILVRDGVAHLKILRMAERMDVSRSSFYWYFESRKDLLAALLDHWEETNTARILHNCTLDGDTITAAVCNFFRCFVDPVQFDQGLDFAIREWARRDASVRARVDAADAARISAVTAMFLRYDYPDFEADARARILYFMQLGYHALDQSEAFELRFSRIEGYLLGFTGVAPEPETVAAFRAFAELKIPA